MNECLIWLLCPAAACFAWLLVYRPAPPFPGLISQLTACLSQTPKPRDCELYRARLSIITSNRLFNLSHRSSNPPPLLSSFCATARSAAPNQHPDLASSPALSIGRTTTTNMLSKQLSSSHSQAGRPHTTRSSTSSRGLASPLVRVHAAATEEPDKAQPDWTGTASQQQTCQ